MWLQLCYPQEEPVEASAAAEKKKEVEEEEERGGEELPCHETRQRERSDETVKNSVFSSS